VPGTADLRAIACPSDSACYAVGDNSSGLVLVAWNIPGLRSPVVAGIATSGLVGGLPVGGIVLQGIACPNASVCDAFGYAEVNVPDGPTFPFGLLFRIDTSSLNSHGYIDGDVVITQGSGIACLPNDICYAVATSYNNQSQGAMVNVTDGNVGAVQVLDTAYPSDLNAVACVSSGSCFAVGGGSAGTVVAPILRGNLDTADATLLPVNSLTSIACNDNSYCYSVGSTSNQGLLASFVVVTVDAIAPSKGPWPGGTEVTITGTGFSITPGATAFGVQSLDGEFGPVPLTDVVCSSSITCTGIMPRWTFGGQVLVRATIDGYPSLADGVFTYSAPQF
jgi:hypothetical protein